MEVFDELVYRDALARARIADHEETLRRVSIGVDDLAVPFGGRWGIMAGQVTDAVLGQREEPSHEPAEVASLEAAQTAVDGEQHFLGNVIRFNPRTQPVRKTRCHPQHNAGAQALQQVASRKRLAVKSRYEQARRVARRHERQNSKGKAADNASHGRVSSTSDNQSLLFLEGCGTDEDD